MARVLSGIQPSGEVHLGNYIGAIRHWVRDQDVDDSFILIVDLHAITVPQDPGTLRRATLDLAATLLAAGIDPGRSTLWVQSQVHEHAELAWVLGCFTGFGELRRMTQFKDRTAKGGESLASAGLFTYPVLQAADILLYRAERVPVGEDQRQHLELTRDVAQRFNGRFGEAFVVPEAAVPQVGARIMDLQAPTSKMSKSAESPAGTIRVTDTPDEITRKMRTAVTDSGREIVASPEKPAITNLLTIYSVSTGRSVEELERDHEGKGYADLKSGLADALVEFLRPLRERYRALSADPGEIERLLAVGADKASAVAAKTLDDVYEKLGFLRPAT
ncbi:MAG TPA: tryptophan--tRNA ligase [Actinomycetota bacterium]|nr:tryptophan--tRNA ligase [Actinomycetota bacterium]